MIIGFKYDCFMYYLLISNLLHFFLFLQLWIQVISFQFRCWMFVLLHFYFFSFTALYWFIHLITDENYKVLWLHFNQIFFIVNFNTHHQIIDTYVTFKYGECVRLQEKCILAILVLNGLRL